jgi:hypothetical protein
MRPARAPRLLFWLRIRAHIIDESALMKTVLERL